MSLPEKIIFRRRESYGYQVCEIRRRQLRKVERWRREGSVGRRRGRGVKLQRRVCKVGRKMRGRPRWRADHRREGGGCEEGGMHRRLGAGVASYSGRTRVHGGWKQGYTWLLC